MIRKIILSTILVTLAGCSHIYGEKGVIKNRDTDYLSARNTAPLRMPPGYSSSTIQAHYPISDRSYSQSQQRIDLTPPELQPEPQARPQMGKPQSTAETITPSPARKQRYLTDAISHPEYIKESFVPGNKTSATDKKEPATTSSPEMASKETNTPTVQQAENNTASLKKKKYIADYFR